ncbi:unnamed protein product [Adineta ricciae]|uniref:Uncharacterized protein n=1 Tax=Adineta ricciae TaxID=249248 RepID=A0A814FXE8_ADIRI|nr:unnamed protein product [Adineta ricciae]CAF0988816.1 unnamed protein product [Adineta ricciae]
MASATVPRNSVQAKSLTLLELCQTIHDLRHMSSRDTSQILTRRLYFHPVNTKSSYKPQSSKLIARGILRTNPMVEEKPTSSFRKRTSPHDLSILSSSFSLVSRTHFKTNICTTTENDDNNDLETSTITSSLNQISLAPITQRPPVLSKKKMMPNKSLYVPNPNKRTVLLTEKNDKKRMNVWNYLHHNLDRPFPQDPPTTPLHYSTDFDIQNQKSYYSLPDIIN